MSFTDFSIFSSSPFCSAKRNHFSNFGIGPFEEHFCANILKSGSLAKDEMLFKDFLFVALAAILFKGAEPLQPSWISDRHNFSSFQSRSRPVATDQVLAQSDQRFAKRQCRKLIFEMVAVAAILDFLSAHLAILCVLGALMPIVKFRFNWIIEEMSKI